MAIMTMLAVIGLVGNLSVAIVTFKHRQGFKRYFSDFIVV